MGFNKNQNTSLPIIHEMYLHLIEDLEAAQGRSITNSTAKKISEVLSRVEWKEANEIVRSIVRLSNPPRNIYGTVLEAVEDVARDRAHALETRERWNPAGVDKLTSAEWLWDQKVREEIMLWHDMKLAARNETYCQPMSIDEWINAGRPKTWSTILDHYLAGSEKAYRNTVAGNESALAKFAEAYYKMLVSEREKRTKTEKEIFF